MTDSENRDRIDERLRHVLQSIDQRVADLGEGAMDAFDPDALIDRLDETAHDLCQAVAGLESTLDEPSEDNPADLREVIEQGLAETLDEVSFPVIVTTSFDDSIPSLPLGRRPVLAMLRKTFGLCLAHAGHGGELRVATARHEGRATIRVDVVRGESGTDTTTLDELGLRFASVIEFVDRIGGAVEFDAADAEALRLRIDLPASAHAR